MCCCKSNRMMRKKVKVFFCILPADLHEYCLRIFVFSCLFPFHLISVCVTPRLCVIYFYTLFLSLGFTLPDTNMFAYGHVEGCGHEVWAVKSTVSLSIQLFLNV